MSGDKVTALLAILAEQCGEKLSEVRLEFLLRQLLKHGADRACDALTRLIETARRFPTIAEVKAEMGIIEASDEDKARDAADRIWTALCRWGSRRTDAAVRERTDYLGPLALEVVKRAGGWEHLCEVTTNADCGIFKAQWREAAALYLRKARHGDIDTPPDFSQLPEVARGELIAMTRKFDVVAGGDE